MTLAAFRGLDLRWFSVLRAGVGAENLEFPEAVESFCSDVDAHPAGSSDSLRFAADAAEWVRSARQQCTELEGLRVWMTSSRDLDQFRLNLRWLPGEGRRVLDRVGPSGLSTVNAVCASDLTGSPFGAEGIETVCRRSAQGPIWLSVATAEGVAGVVVEAGRRTEEKRLSLTLQSSHPSQSSVEPLTFRIEQPGARIVRLHFTRVDPEPSGPGADASQSLEIATPGGPVQHRFEEAHVRRWSPPIELDRDSALELRLHCRASCWGFEVDELEVLYP